MPHESNPYLTNLLQAISNAVLRDCVLQVFSSLQAYRLCLLHATPFYLIQLYFIILVIQGYSKWLLGLATCHIQRTWDRSICIFLFNRTTLQVFVTYLTGALYVHPSWFYKHQHDNRVRSKLFVACQRWWFQWRFWFVPSVPGYLREEEEHKSLDPSVQLHTAISSVLCMTSCYNPDNHFE